MYICNYPNTLIELLFSSPIAFVIVGISLIIAITIHEFSHAWVADLLGDPTPRALNRVSLNPLEHLDPIGTIAILLVGFGWGKPVPYDPYNLDNPKRDTLLIALAGPASNIILAIILAIILNFIPSFGYAGFIMQYIIQINVMLAVFNMVPIVPLDGSKILISILPEDKAIEYESFATRYSTMLLLFLIFPFGGRSIISMIISPIISMITSLLI